MYKLKMTLLSDSLPGVGQEYGNLVDNDISIDKYGLPIVKGKRFKGILRESARELQDLGLLHNKVNEIFKKEEIAIKSFRLSNGYIEKYEEYVKFIKYLFNLKDPIVSQIFNPMSILDYFAYIRNQTATDYDKGISKKHSLRASRVVRKGLVFYFDIDFNKNYIDDIKNICKVTRDFGANRNRGLGNIKLELIEESDSKLSQLDSKRTSIIEQLKKCEDKELIKLHLKLKNQEQVLVSNKAGESDSTEYFFPGSTILGALADKYIKKRGIQNAHEDDNFSNLFLNNKTTFSNFYPSYQNKTYFPVPISLVKEKNKENYLDLTISERPKDKDLLKLKDFVYIDKSDDIKSELKFESPKIYNQIEYHHARPADRSIGRAIKYLGNFFQYDVLECNQNFAGFVIGTKKELDVILNLFDSDQMIINLGKSRTAQYGKSVLELESIQVLSKEKINIQNQNDVLITLESDMILRNESGFIYPDISILVKELTNLLGINYENVSIKKKFLKFKIIGGFSRIWNLYKIQRYALSAGSEILMEIKEQNSLDFTKIIGKSFGINTAEGYGLIKINWHRNEKIKKKEPESELYEPPENLNSIFDFIDYILKAHLILKLREKAHDNSKTIKFDSISISTLQRIKDFIEISQSNKELIDIFNQITKEFKKKLVKICKILYININQQFIFDENEFKKFLFTLIDFDKSNVSKNNVIQKVKNRLLNEIYPKIIFKLYKEYCRTLLIDLIYQLK